MEETGVCGTFLLASNWKGPHIDYSIIKIELLLAAGFASS